MSGPYDGERPSQPTGSFKAGPIGMAASVLVGLTALSEVPLVASEWHDYALYKDNLQGYDPDAISALDGILGIVAVAAGVTFILWLRQVRGNAERFCKAPHRRSRSWLIGGWICPVVNLWFPKQIVDDIVAASTPRTDPHANDLPRLRAGIVQIWWITWIASTVVGLADPTVFADQPSANDLLTTALISTASGVLTVICGMYAIRVIQLINNLQASRPWVAWWETTDSATSTS
jgi:hypothetical protein